MSRTVLFVDDMADMGALIVDMLQLEGIDADWCGSGAEAARRLEVGDHRALITDLCLGGPTDGRVLAGIAREQSIPALVISGDVQAIEQLKAAGLDTALKPVDVPVLIDWLRRHAPTHAAAG